MPAKLILPLLLVLLVQPDKSEILTIHYNGTRWNFTWQDSRRLVTASTESREISYTYAIWRGLDFGKRVYAGVEWN